MSTTPPPEQPLSRRELRERERAAAAAGRAADESSTDSVAPAAPAVAPPAPSSFAPEAPRAYERVAPSIADDRVSLSPLSEPYAATDGSIDRPLTRRELRAMREAQAIAVLPAEQREAEAAAAVVPEVEVPEAEVPEAEVAEADETDATNAAAAEETPALTPYEEWQRRMGLRAAEQAAGDTADSTSSGDGAAFAVPSPPAVPRADASTPAASGAPSAPLWGRPLATPVDPIVSPDPVTDPVTEPEATAAEETPEEAGPAEAAAASGAVVLAGEQAVVLAPAPAASPWSRPAEPDDETSARAASSRELGAAPIITNALVFDTPADAPMSPTGDVFATGSIQLPASFTQSGFANQPVDSGEHDHTLDPGDVSLTNTDAQPVRAANAVSIHTETGGSLSLVPQRSNRGIIVLTILAGAMAVIVAGTLIVAIVTGLL